MAKVTLSLSPELWAWTLEIARRTGANGQEVIQEAIILYGQVIDHLDGRLDRVRLRHDGRKRVLQSMQDEGNRP